MKRYVLGGVILAALPLAIFGVLHSQAGAPTPQTAQRLPQFQNEAVAVWKTTLLPNAATAMHRHDHPRVIIALSGGTMNSVPQDGPTEQHVWETGRAYWLPAMPPGAMHADVNAGTKPIEVMVVELEHEK